jgi:hypothetical protein
MFLIKSATFKRAGNDLRIQVRPILSFLFVDVNAIPTGTRLNAFVQTPFTARRFV